MARAVRFTDLFINTKIARCAHSCRYCSISKKDFSDLPFSRFEAEYFLPLIGLKLVVFFPGLVSSRRGIKMSFGVRLHVSGERACFTRPEMKVERVSYDVMTPTAGRGILEAIHWKPAIRWQIDRIHVLKPIRFQSFRRNEVGAKISTAVAVRAMRAGSTAGLGLVVEDYRQQRATTLLVNVAYVIEAHFTLTDKAEPDDTPAKHISMFNRRAAAGQCFHRPCLGTREFAADFELIPEDADLSHSELPSEQRNRDLGWMLCDIEFTADDAISHFFRARLEDGVLDVNRCLKDGTAS
jgi:CRISPR-associated protein Cas5d